ncbi:unnamed protein product [Paramecium sonneborni]|uniref:MORN repeat-containing protein 3 n=1 Tax=Paramecium sonneborni TaxID=65129 RepID=A0A8S1LHM4_9CILI|nr:unnamed protein product [Paramecium sonneborni]
MKLFNFLQKQTSNEHHIIYSNKDEYHGEMKDNMKHGKGVYKFTNGNRYEGEWQFNEKHGNGKYFYNSGELYIGQWQHNKKNGHGQHFGIYGDRYVGQWVNNCKHGRGTIYYTENSIYSGEFFENKKHGPGYYYNSNTRELTYQLYDNDKLKEQKIVHEYPVEFENVFSAFLARDNNIKHPQELPNNKQLEELHQIQQETHGIEKLKALNETEILKGKKKSIQILYYIFIYQCRIGIQMKFVLGQIVQDYHNTKRILQEII